VLLDQFSKLQSLVELAYQDQAAIGSDARTLEIDFEGRVEGKLKGLFWAFTHWFIYFRKFSKPLTPA